MKITRIFAVSLAVIIATATMAGCAARTTRHYGNAPSVIPPVASTPNVTTPRTTPDHNNNFDNDYHNRKSTNRNAYDGNRRAYDGYRYHDDFDGNVDGNRSDGQYRADSNYHSNDNYRNDGHHYNNTTPGTNNNRNTTSPNANHNPNVSGRNTIDHNRRAATTMNTDFSEIGVLDATKRGWGPGGPTDSAGRPDGATLFQNRYGQYDAIFIAPNENKIYLTFDEGYEYGLTDSILDTLKKTNVKAVFFITMPYAKGSPELVQRMIDEGHVVANHSTKHLSFPDMPLAEAAKDIMELHDYIAEHFNYEMNLFRPPMGEFNEQTLALAQSLGYKSVFWSWAYVDWHVDNQPVSLEALHAMASRAHPGAIYLLHAVSQTNDDVLEDMIKQIRELGYVFSPWDL